MNAVFLASDRVDTKLINEYLNDVSLKLTVELKVITEKLLL